jgi:hypothetical protein
MLYYTILGLAAAFAGSSCTCINTKGLPLQGSDAVQHPSLLANKMGSDSAPSASDARTPLTREELSQAFEIDVYDREGKTKTLGDLVKGQRTVLVFIRHFCKFICQVCMQRVSHFRVGGGSTQRILRSFSSRNMVTEIYIHRVFELSSLYSLYQRVYTPRESASIYPKYVGHYLVNLPRSLS